MPLVKKIKAEWEPSENKGLKVGETIDMTDAQRLVDQGLAVYVDENGNELQRKGHFDCPICTFTTDNPYALANHILMTHPRKGSAIAAATQEKAEEPVKNEESVVPVEKEMSVTESIVKMLKEEEEKKRAEGKEAPEASPKTFKDMTDEEKKAWRVENLRKGREKKQVEDATKSNA